MGAHTLQFVLGCASWRHHQIENLEISSQDNEFMAQLSNSGDFAARSWLSPTVDTAITCALLPSTPVCVRRVFRSTAVDPSRPPPTTHRCHLKHHRRGELPNRKPLTGQHCATSFQLSEGAQKSSVQTCERFNCRRRQVLTIKDHASRNLKDNTRSHETVQCLQPAVARNYSQARDLCRRQWCSHAAKNRKNQSVE